jgi:hypothetical protein
MKPTTNKLGDAERAAAEMAAKRGVSVGIWRKGDDYYVATANATAGRAYPKDAECLDEIGPAQAKRMLEMM